MAQTDDGELVDQVLVFSPEEVGRRPVQATVDIRLVGLTEHPDIVAVRYYFQDEERLFRLVDPDDQALQDLRGALSFVAKLVPGDPLATPPGNRLDLALARQVNDLLGGETLDHDDGAKDVVTDLWKAWQSLNYLAFFVLSSGFLALTPAPRPLLQLAIELQDLLFGRSDGSLLKARSTVRAARRGGELPQELAGCSAPCPNAAVPLTPFQGFFHALAASASQIEVDDDALWLGACSRSLAAAIEYLRLNDFSPGVLQPINRLQEALCQELSGRHSKLLDEHFDDRHGPELLTRRAPRLHRHFTDRLIVNAREQFKLARRSRELGKTWFDEQLRILGLRNEKGIMVTSDWVKRLGRRQNDRPKPDSGFFRYRKATDRTGRTVFRELGIVGKQSPSSNFIRRQGGEDRPVALPPEWQIAALLQTALLYEPRHLRKGARNRGGAKDTKTTGVV